MSYQVVRVAKNKATSIGFVQRHNLRQYDQKHKAPSNVDSSKTHLNYALIECDKFKSAVKEKVDEVQAQQTRRIRKDCPTSLEYVISASPEFFEKASASEQREYFNSALKFIKNRHEVENVISAVVHMDEETPHMHVVVVPIRKNEKGLKLDPKSFCTPRELSKLHSEFNECVGRTFGLSRGEQSERQHKSVAEYQRELAREVAGEKEELARVKEELEKEKEELAEYQDREFSMPQLEIPAPKLMESKVAYGKRAFQSAIDQINPAFKTLKAKTFTARRERNDLAEKLESASSKLAEEQNKGETYKRIAEPLIALYKQIKANLDMTLTEFFNIVLDNTVQTFKEEIELAKNQEPSKTLSPNKRNGLER